MAPSQPNSDEADERFLPETTIITLPDSEKSAFLSLLRDAVREGRRLHIQTPDGETIAVLLTRTEYEILNAAAELAGSPAHCASLLHYSPPETMLSVSELFDPPNA